MFNTPPSHRSSCGGPNSFRLALAQIPKLSPYEATTAGDSSWSPAVDIFEDISHFIVNAQLPGIDPDGVEVVVDERSLTISGRKQWAPAGYKPDTVISEKSRGPFRRDLALPAPVKTHEVRCCFTDGVLTILLPKNEQKPLTPIKIHFIR
ncbi:MAG TPA: Hsp20/alpha crystallin family protein [bacterium]|nr:Hsp20/alpha crystallin family protein [Candidatus Omnitrophota bacterium]HOL95088.1 Hsp20/alpha crystallin family protein [bacterium]HPP01738.1 Hsp20/alpha crystallin family protein [bacterium]HXK95932.1 Hsp20/alpha crystallin family protein [bacterium]